jgi:hypothetical protein
VTAPATTVSITTAPTRFTGTPRAWRVTPEEYMSMVLIARSCTMASTRNGQKNQEANDDGTPVTDVTCGLTT